MRFPLAQIPDVPDLGPSRDQLDSWWETDPEIPLLLAGLVLSWVLVVIPLAVVVRLLWVALQDSQNCRTEDPCRRLPHLSGAVHPVIEAASAKQSPA